MSVWDHITPKLRMLTNAIKNLEFYKTGQAFFSALQKKCKDHHDVQLNGTYTTPEDPLVSNRERVQMLAHEVWKVTGYRFT
jgi:hypothetical protein